MTALINASTITGRFKKIINGNKIKERIVTTRYKYLTFIKDSYATHYLVYT